MKIENNDNEQAYKDWKDRINNLTRIEGEPRPDFNRMWARLEARLTEPHKKKKRPIVYWLAAASLLAAILIYGALQFRERPHEMVQKPAPKAKQKFEQTMVNNKTADMKEAATHLKQEQKAVVKLKIDKMLTVPKEMVQSYKLEPDSVHYTAIMNSMQLPVRNKLAVNPDDKEPIHLNEIKFGGPVTPVAGNSNRKPVTIQLRDQQATITIEQDAPVSTIQSLHEN